VRVQFGTWLREPIVMPRWVLQILYALFFVLGLVTVVRDVVILERVVGESLLRWVLAVLVTLGALIAGVASTRARWGGVEAWAALAIWGAMSGYLVAAAILATSGSAWFSLVLLILATGIVFARWLSLLWEKGARGADRR
jgi:hypothetical protein